MDSVQPFVVVVGVVVLLALEWVLAVAGSYVLIVLRVVAVVQRVLKFAAPETAVVDGFDILVELLVPHL